MKINCYDTELPNVFNVHNVYNEARKGIKPFICDSYKFSD